MRKFSIIWIVSVLLVATQATAQQYYNVNQATVKLVLYNAVDESLSRGSGVIVKKEKDSFQVLTCAHLFFNSLSERIVLAPSQYHVTCHIFNPFPKRSYKGELLSINSIADLALVKFTYHNSQNLMTIRISRDNPKVDDKVVHLGFGRGRVPCILIPTVVTALDRFKAKYIGCQGINEKGRSGGPLCNIKGELIGIASAVCPEDNMSLFANLEEIKEILKR